MAYSPSLPCTRLTYSSQALLSSADIAAIRFRHPSAVSDTHGSQLVWTYIVMAYGPWIPVGLDLYSYGLWFMDPSWSGPIYLWPMVHGSQLVWTYIVMAYKVMAYIVIAYVVMACIVTAYAHGSQWGWIYRLGAIG